MPRRGCPNRCTARCWPGPSAACPTRTTRLRSASSGLPPTWPVCRRSADLSTTVMGQSISLPVIISPTGVQAVHPDGEVAVARAAAARGTAIGLSSFASKPIEEVVAADPQTSSRCTGWGPGKHRAPDGPGARSRREGPDRHPGLVVLAQPGLGQPDHPETMNLKAMLQFAPEALSRPRWLLGFARPGMCRTSTTPTLPTSGSRHRRSSVRTASGCRRRLVVGRCGVMREQWEGPHAQGRQPRR